MSGWSRTTKPSADTTIPANQIFGVDGNEIAVTEGPAHTGWVRRRTVGSRVLFETLVAMKNAPTEDNADDAVFPDTIITITSQPAASSVSSGSAASFAVVASASPAATLTYQWQESTDGGSFWVILSDAGVYSGTATDTLAISNNTGLDTNLYRCVITGTNTGASVTSNSALLTEL